MQNNQWKFMGDQLSTKSPIGSKVQILMSEEKRKTVLLRMHFDPDLYWFEDIYELVPFHEQFLPCETGLEKLPVTQSIALTHKSSRVAFQFVKGSGKLLTESLSHMKLRICFRKSLHRDKLVRATLVKPVLSLIFSRSHLHRHQISANSFPNPM